MSPFVRVSLIALGLAAVFTGFVFRETIYLNLRDPDALLTGWQDYSAAEFAGYLDRGDPVLVEVYASWCPTCLLQHRALLALETNGTALPVRAVRVDFDRDQDFIQRYYIQGTGFMMLFKGGSEIDRRAGLVTPEQITSFLSDNGFAVTTAP